MDTLDLQWQTLKALLDWRVTLDIILLALGFFFLYHTLRASGTWKIVLGIGLAAVVFIVARFLNLRGIEWIYTNLSPVLLLAMIIIFQPEIRRIFERAASIRPREEIREATKISHIMADAMFAMSERKRGALFVLPAKESIRARVSEGIQLDALITFPILLSIFDPNSPGHDGAVIIEKSRIAAFGVRLPLSQSGTLSEIYGTRHHAALGLCEVSDAMVIAVSEERGTVTVFKQGQFLEAGNKEQLAETLLAHLESAASYELPGADIKNRRVLITELAVSLLLAFLFWSTVILTEGGN